MSLAFETPLLVLAGGRATRLKNLSENLPKYLMPVGAMTFADLHLKWIADQGFKKVFLSVGYLGQQIMDHCQSGQKWNLEISYLSDGDQPLGTGGAIRESLRFPFKNLAVTYGDTLLNFPVEKFLEDFAESKAWAGMTYCENLPGHSANVTPLSSNRIIYNKKTPSPDWKHIDYGFLALQRDFIENFSKETPLDLAIPLHMASEKGQLMGTFCREKFWEIGSVEALENFQKKHKG